MHRAAPEQSPSKDRYVMLLRSLSACVVAALAIVGGTVASAGERAVLQPVHTYIDAANAGDRQRLITAFAASSAIVDEFAPFRFPAPNAAAHWFDGFVADQRASGVTDAVITYTAPKFVSVVSTNAYVVLPTIYTYKIHGKPAKEVGSLAFTLGRRGTHWKITSMSWAKVTDTSEP